MTIIDGIVHGPIAVTTDTELTGIVSGTIIVAAGYRLRISGIVSGSVVLDGDAAVEIPGMFDGEIVRR